MDLRVLYHVQADDYTNSTTQQSVKGDDITRSGMSNNLFTGVILFKASAWAAQRLFNKNNTEHLKQLTK